MHINAMHRKANNIVNVNVNRKYPNNGSTGFEVGRDDKERTLILNESGKAKMSNPMEDVKANTKLLIIRNIFT